MNSWNDREKAAEGDYKRKEELAFKITARRNKLLGLWVAERLGITGAEADAYARTVVEADFEKPGDDDVIDKVLADLAKVGKPSTAAEIRSELTRWAAEAKQQLSQG